MEQLGENPRPTHGLGHVKQRRWRIYPYRVNRMQDQQQLVNPKQDLTQ
jgi:hypothetical protein